MPCPTITSSKLIQPGAFDDQLTEVLRSGARALLAQAVEAEVAEFLAKHADLKTEDGRQRVVRHGHLPEREVMTGIGPVAVRQPRVRDREAAADDPAPHPLHAVDPAALHAPLEVDRDAAADPLPEGHLDRRLLGGAGGLARQGCGGAFGIGHRPPQGRLAGRACGLAEARSVGQALRLHLGRRHPSGGPPGGREAVHPRADRRDAGGQEGARRLHRRRAGKCARLARSAARSEAPRARRVAPELAIADGALGFWKAPARCGRRRASSAAGCTRPRTCSNKLPKSQQPKAKRALQEIWMAETKARTPRPRSTPSSRATQVKYEKAADCLAKDRDALLAFYDFPAEHWKHLRTTNPIESTFATVRHRTIRSKGCLSNKTALAMVFKLVEAAQRSWRRLDGHDQLPKLILGVKFSDGLEVVAKPAALKPTTAAA